MSQPGVMVTLEQIYAQQQAIGRKVDNLATKFEERSDHESRIRALERKVWVASGASAAVAAVLSGGVVQAINAAMGG